jgi:chromosome segregation ATPase
LVLVWFSFGSRLVLVWFSFGSRLVLVFILLLEKIQAEEKVAMLSSVDNAEAKLKEEEGKACWVAVKELEVELNELKQDRATMEQVGQMKELHEKKTKELAEQQSEKKKLKSEITQIRRVIEENEEKLNHVDGQLDEAQNKMDKMNSQKNKAVKKIKQNGVIKQKILATIEQKRREAKNAKGQLQQQRQQQLNRLVTQVDVAQTNKDQAQEDLDRAQQAKRTALPNLSEDESALESLRRIESDLNRSKENHDEAVRNSKNLIRRQQSGGSGISWSQNVQNIVQKMNSNRSPINPDNVRGPFAQYIGLNKDTPNASQWARSVKCCVCETVIHVGTCGYMCIHVWMLLFL